MLTSKREPELYMPRIFYAWDDASFTEGKSQFLKRMVGLGYDIKVGATALHSYNIHLQSVGALAAHRCIATGGRTAADLKFYDIPEQLEGGVKGLIQFGHWGITVRLPKDVEFSTLSRIAAVRDHAFKAIEEREQADEQKKLPDPEKPRAERLKPVLFAFSQLSTHNRPPEEVEADLMRIGQLSQKAGLGGIVVPGKFLEKIERAFPGLEKLVVGIRPEGLTKGWLDNQRHTISHLEAVEVGGKKLNLVIGRPISRNENPLQAAGIIMNDLRTRPFSQVELVAAQ